MSNQNLHTMTNILEFKSKPVKKELVKNCSSCKNAINHSSDGMIECDYPFPIWVYMLIGGKNLKDRPRISGTNEGCSCWNFDPMNNGLFPNRFA